eukprot:7052875-Prymnesium_polylepis.1
MANEAHAPSVLPTTHTARATHTCRERGQKFNTSLPEERLSKAGRRGGGCPGFDRSANIAQEVAAQQLDEGDWDDC